MQTFEQALVEIYKEQPCKVLPNALWKTRQEIEYLQTRYEIANQKVRYLEAKNHKKLLCYWHRNQRQLEIPVSQLQELPLVLLHQDYVTKKFLDAFPRKKQYFRLTYRLSEIARIGPNFQVLPAGHDDQVDEIVNFLRVCYPAFQVSREMVQTWKTHPVYDPGLWIWVTDDKGQKMGLGIAEFDPLIKEGSLEWVQVLPEFRRGGVGTEIVRCLLVLLHDRADIITVSGEVESQFRPDLLYRNCGFEGSDVFWLFRKESP